MEANSLGDRRSAYYGHFELEVLIDRPVTQVWQQYLNIPSWVTSHHIETIHGEPGTVGSITRVSFKRAEEAGLPLPHYHYCRLIKVVPEKQWLLKTYSEKGGSYGFELNGFDDGRVFATGNKTKVIFNLFLEYESRTGSMDFSPDAMQKNLENLKRILEE